MYIVYFILTRISWTMPFPLSQLHCESKRCHPNQVITLSILDGFAEFFYCCKEY